MFVNPSSLHSFRYVRYPISKERLLDAAEDVQASWEVVEALEELPDGYYHSANEVFDSIDRL